MAMNVAECEAMIAASKGEEGLQDLRIIEAIKQSIASGMKVTL